MRLAVVCCNFVRRQEGSNYVITGQVGVLRVHNTGLSGKDNSCIYFVCGALEQ